MFGDIGHGERCSGAENPSHQEEESSGESEIGQSSAREGGSDDFSEIPEERPRDEHRKRGQIRVEIETVPVSDARRSATFAGLAVASGVLWRGEDRDEEHDDEGESSEAHPSPQVVISLHFSFEVCPAVEGKINVCHWCSFRLRIYA